MIDNEIKQIHDATVRILTEIGMEFNDEEILKLFKEDGVKVEGNRVYLNEEDLFRYINYAPKEFTIHARNEKYNMNINTKSTHYVPGYGAPKIREVDGNLRNATLNDYRKFCRLVQSSELFNINGGIVVQPYDVEADISSLVMLYTTIIESDKCIMGIPGNKEKTTEVMELVSLAFGGEEKLKEKHRIITLISTLSPLSIDNQVVECIKVCCDYNQPMIVTPGPMAGATGPISLAGNIAMGNAETLATICAIQLYKKDTPVIYGHVCTASELKSGNVSIGTPGFTVQGKYGTRLSKYYDIPCRTLGTESDANGVTAQAGYESMMSMFAARQENSNFIIHSAGILDGFTSMSYEKFIVDLEVIKVLEYYFKQLEISEKTLAIDVIKDVVNKGIFLTHKHTVKRCRKDPYNSDISVIGQLRLEVEPEKLLANNINKTIAKLLDNYEVEYLDEDIVENMKIYMREKGVRMELL